MSKELVISAAPHETRVAILEEGQLCEIYIEREKEFALVGSIYKGRVTRVLPGMQSAFVDIGLDGDAFLYVSDFLEHLEEYDHVVSTVETKVEKMEQQGGQVFSPAPPEVPMSEQPPAIVTEEPAAADQPSQPAEHIILPGETRGGGNSSQEQGQVPSSQPGYSRHGRPPERRDRDARGGFGRDRSGGGGPRGRWGRRGGRGGDRRPGRDLPPSKYASSRPYERRPFDRRPSEPRPFEPAPSGGEPILLPGESLAKYKDRPATPPPASATDAGAVAESPATTQHLEGTSESHAEGHSEELHGSLPSSLYVSETSAPSSEEAGAEHFEPAPPAEPGGFGHREEFESHEVLEETDEMDARAEEHHGLSEDEAISLAEQLAEAKHEEAQEEAEAAAGEPEIDGEGQQLAGEPHLETDADEEITGQETAEGEAAEEELPGDLHPLEASGEMTTEQSPASGILPGETRAAASASEPSDVQPTQARIQDSRRARFQRPMRRGGRDRGRRPGGPPRPHHHERPGGRGGYQPQRRPQLISEMLKAGEEIIVQIAKEPLGKKGARITSHVALPGRFLVYMPTVDHIGVSRKIASAENRSRLRRLVNESKGTFPGGFIVRTAAAGATDDEIRSDVEFLGHTWDEIRGRSEQRRAPSLLHRDLNLVERILRDYLSDDYTAIWIDNQEEYSKIVEFVGRFQPKMVNRVKLYTKDAPIFEEFGIQQELDKALRPKVWLKSGGYIVINHTEALVAIDVNTGKYVGKGSSRLEDTIVKTNLEAVKEIVRQIRLRDLGGIIVLDLIDMEERRNREKVMAALDAALETDRAPSKVLSFNEFGLVSITRKRTKQALERVLCQPCPYCTGSGMVKSVPTICYEIQAEARKMAGELDSQSVTLRVNPEIAKALKTRESSLVEELEQATRKSVIIQSDPTLHWEQYDIY
ncbi:MAG TPA: Rne/Rng family ribonuclease [Candidatus Acidoferrales bacterium]|nr:Rne/Rng family ribonuclease [Candidatus Acidoferrales bacterium]